MTLDIRIPIGLLFTLIGALLVLYGLLSAAPANNVGGVNLNATWGAGLIIFGLCMLLLARRAAAAARRSL
jgi:hypothetical protein